MSLEHRALLYGDMESFVEATVPFLESGLEREQAVIAVAREPGLSALRDILKPHGNAVLYFDSARFYEHPVRTLRDYQTIVRQSEPRTVCALAEPVWDGWTELQTREWVRYESLINVVFAHSGARALCPYDTAQLAPRIIEDARRTHPVVVGDGHDGANDAYVDPARLGMGCDRARRFDRPGASEYMAIDGADLHALRAFVAERATAHGLGRRPAQNLVTAVNEVAANALQHGVPPMGLWIWRDGDDLVCEIGDNGFWRPSPLTGFIPPDSALQRGFGLWTVRLLVDLMELRAGWDGTFVRLHVRR
ncbi:anti-sigma factor RsbA family regulatory protein [Actinomadura fibrosa]|uniref:Anti-sigma factor RsbA family regulatory protein n=1 Tax=Actinomadura fibrosa TaxID=111802 RepID=A0ABW2XQQ6_9ACTN|nr:anti-sigma factor RsbA family regulatory protein [Actinomadura fibrosa]